MLLTITTTHQPATDLGFLLHKNPARTQTFPLSFGKAHVFYPEAAPERCTAALMLDINPLELVRGHRSYKAETLENYVNDRAYAASSFLSVAMAEVFSSAMNGKCKDRPLLVGTALPLKAMITPLPCRGGDALLRRLFEPLGYTVSAVQHPLDEVFPDWGESLYHTVILEALLPLAQFLTHLYVLIPVLDNDKHYWVGDDEVEKLLRRGEGWLASHPERDLIVSRYLKRRKGLETIALAALLAEDAEDIDAVQAEHADEEAEVEKKISLNEQRMQAVVEAVRSSGATRVLDVGCGEGKLIAVLLKEKQIEKIVGLDVSHRALEIASSKLRLETMPEKQRERILLMQGSLTYRDKRLAGYDAAAAVEVIEHLDLSRLAAFERVLFEFAAPQTVVITTPNREYNAKFETLSAGKFRHKDHRFEWTRTEFGAWAMNVAARFEYDVRFEPIGDSDESLGAPTQMAVFAKRTKNFSPSSTVSTAPTEISTEV